MKLRPISPHHHGWVVSILDKKSIDFLWKRIEEGTKGIVIDAKPRLAGNISTSSSITDDEDGYFLNIENCSISLLVLIIFFILFSFKKRIFFIPNELSSFTSLIFLSPTFRSLAIWPDSRLFGLILFAMSIYYFLKFIIFRITFRRKKNTKNY